jgi:hypothetical protein
MISAFNAIEGLPDDAARGVGDVRRDGRTIQSIVRLELAIARPRLEVVATRGGVVAEAPGRSVIMGRGQSFPNPNDAASVLLATSA